MNEEKPIKQKIKIYTPTPYKLWHVFWCPGCKETHTFEIGYDKWIGYGTMDAPSYYPSLSYAPKCHLVLRRGIIHFCGDCQHELVGKSVPLEEF